MRLANTQFLLLALHQYVRCRSGNIDVLMNGRIRAMRIFYPSKDPIA
jgi:hypothetical protein